MPADKTTAVEAYGADTTADYEYAGEYGLAENRQNSKRNYFDSHHRHHSGYYSITSNCSNSRNPNRYSTIHLYFPCSNDE